MRTCHGGGFGCRGAGGGRAGIERLSSGLLPTRVTKKPRIFPAPAGKKSLSFFVARVLPCPGVFVWARYGSRAASEICGNLFFAGLVATYKVLGRALQLLEVERYGRNVCTYVSASRAFTSVTNPVGS